MGSNRRRKRRETAAERTGVPPGRSLGETPSPAESQDTTNRNTHVSILITIACTIASVSPIFLREKFVAAGVLFVFGIVSILYANVVAKPLSRKIALVIGSVLLIEGITIATYRALQPEATGGAAAVTGESSRPRATFNETRERHYPVVQVASYSADPGCTTCWKSNVEAKPGDLVSFNILVVNTAWGVGADTGVTARNVAVSFATEQAGTGLITTAKISAENAAPLASEAQVHVPPAYRDVRFSAIWEALGYRYEKAKWVRTESPGVPPTLYLGDVLPGWPSQRVIVLQYRVEGTPIEPRTGCIPLHAKTLTTGVINPTWAELRGAGRTADTSRSWFDFGVTAAFGWSVEDAGGVGTVRVLQPGTTYYYRYVVQNECGWTSFGDTQSFTTSQPTDLHDYPDPANK